MNLNNFIQNFRPSKWTKYFIALSISILLIGIVMFSIMGFNLGMDFTGGSVIEVEVGETLEQGDTFTTLSSQIETILEEKGLKASSMQIKGEDADASIEVQYQNKSGLTDAEISNLNTDIQSVLEEQLGFTVSQSEAKGATSTAETLTFALMAIFIALIAMLIYIAIRFELLSGVAALVALFHDVILMCAFVAIFRIEVNSSFIAAVITILGYSINNTIIIFDRIRENMKKQSLGNLSVKEIADLSVKQTLRRTINTSLTTILAVFLLAIFGVASMREFVLPILFGLIVGTYAAIFISAQIWAYLASRSGKVRDFTEKTNQTVLNNGVVETTATPIHE